MQYYSYIIYCAYCLFMYVQFSWCPLRALNWSINWIELNWIEYVHFVQNPSFVTYMLNMICFLMNETSSIFLICSLYGISFSLQQYYFYYTNEPVVHLGFVGFICSMFAIGLAIGVTIAVGMLFFIQVSKLVSCPYL